VSFLLDKPYVGKVTAGFVDIFAVTSKSARRHLLRVEKGESFFGTEGDSEMGLLAVPGANAKIEPGSLDPEQVEVWVTRLSHLIGQLSGESESLLPSQSFELESGQRAAAANQLVWVQLQQGSATFLGLPSATLEPGAAAFPLSRRTWLEATAPTRLRASDTAGVWTEEQGAPALAGFHQYLLTWLAQDQVEGEISERVRAQARAASEEQAVAGALSDLASIMEEREGIAVNEADPLRAACAGVARASGFTIEPGAADSLETISRASHFLTRRVILRGDWWRRDNGPLLGYRGDTPVALLPTSPGSYVELGQQRKKIDAKTDLSPVAYQFYRPLPRAAVSAWRLLRFALRGRRRDLTMVALMGVVGGLLGLLVPVATGFLVDQVIPSADRHQVFLLGMGLVIATLSMALFEFTRAVAVQRIEGKMDGTVQPALWDRILALPLAFFRDYAAGDLAMRAMSIDSIRETLTGSSVSAVLGAIFSLFSLLLMFWYDAELALLAMVPISILVVVAVVAGLIQVSLDRQLLRIEGRISGLVLQLLNGIAKIRVAGGECRAFARWAREFARQKQLSWRSLGVTNVLSVVNSMFGIVAAMVLFFGVSRAPHDSRMSTGAFLAFYAAFVQFSAALLALTSALTSTLLVVPMFERARPILDALPETSELRPDPGVLRGEIELSHVDFRYSEDGPAVLTDVSLHANPGDFVAIVGPSGSGKSTLFRQLLGFETPTSGAVYMDGQDLQNIDLQGVRRQMGVVLQNSRVMPGDIQENILGSSGKSVDDAWEAAAKAGLAEDIEQMPMGMHTVIMEGGGAFSGGQRQRLMIARAIVNHPRILLFDEATSALDSETQEAVTRSLEGLRATRIVIAHRLSTIRHADRIYVMEAGRIVQTGTFDELLKQKGTFERLVRPQMA
jgi:NHLM bacteriocin system ABC transporter ATP-binding protein